MEAPDDLTVVYHLKDPSMMLPELMAPPTSNNVVQSPAAVAAKGDDYNRNPVGTGPFVLKSWTAGDRIVVERNPNYWNAGHPRLDRIVFKPLPDAQSRFASLQSGEADIIWDDEFDYDNIIKAKADKRLTVHTHVGSGAQVYAFNTKVAPFDDLRVRQALVMAIDRKKMSQAITGGLARPAVNPYGDGSWVKCSDDGALPYDPAKARELLKAYGKPVAFKMIVTATPRGRAIGQVLQQFWKQVGATMEIEQVDQATIVPRAFQRQFQITPWRIIDLADPDPQMYANFRTGSPVALANYSNPELDRMLERARVTRRHANPHRRLLRDRPPDQPAGDLVLDLPEHLLRHRQGEGSRACPRCSAASSTSLTPGSSSRRDGPCPGAGAPAVTMIELVGRRLLYLLPVLFGVALLTFLIASLLPGDLAYVLLGDQATPETLAALRHDLGLDQPIAAALRALARAGAAGRPRPLVSHRPDGDRGDRRAAAGVDRADAAGARAAR